MPDQTRDDVLLALHRKIAALELHNKRLERQVEELRAAVAALLAPSPSETGATIAGMSDDNKQPRQQ
jgi:hypothetical protein